MSRCDLEVVLAKPGPFAPGDTVDGFVGVTVNAPCRCRALKVQLQWRTHGRGNRTQGVVAEEIVFSGEWQAGERGLHPFSFTLPAGPFTYQGTNLNVEWAVHATADIPWAIDPKEDAVFELPVPAAFPGPVELGPRAHVPDAPQVIAHAIGLVMGLFVGGFGLFLSATLALIFCGGALSGAPDLPILLALVVPGIFTLVGFFLVRGPAIALLARRRLGPIEVEVPSEAHPGAPLPVRVRLQPTREVQVESITAALVATEVVVSGSGTNRRTHKHELHRSAVTLQRGGQLTAGLPTNLSGTLNVPEGAPLSFGATDNALRWEVVVRVDVPGVLDAEERVAVEVRPPRSAG